MPLADHSNSKRFPADANGRGEPAQPLDAGWLRQLCRDCGADDVGLVDIGRPDLDDQRDDILQAFPSTKTLVSFVCRMNREPIRSPARSVANLESQKVGDHVNDVARNLVTALERAGIRALNPAASYPMEMDLFPGKIWVVAHKPVAVAAGMGQMGIHRNVIHPKFGSFILLGTVLVGAEATAYDQPIGYNPCLGCNLCVAACPVGAITPEGHFDFSACMTHNYREYTGGFNDWIEQVVDSNGSLDYRRRVTEAETASMWQTLSFGANYKAAYCMSVCPAGEDVIGPYINDKPGFVEEMVRPLIEKRETVYVLKNSDAENFVARHFPNKTARQVRSGIQARTIAAFVRGLSLLFQPGKAVGLNAVYHFTFFGKESAAITVTIRDQTLQVQDGLHGKSDLQMRADSQTWLGFLAREKNLLWALLRRKIRIQGSFKLMLAFSKCFPL